MEDLSKQQLILVALLVSFVTALATGIITVSLMNQMPTSVTHTISQVIQRTIQASAPADSSASAANAFDTQVASAVSAVLPSIVKIHPRGSEGVSGLGLIISDKGVIVADKYSIAPGIEYIAVTSDGASFPILVVQSQIDGDIVFMAPAPVAGSPLPLFNAAVAGPSPKLGQMVWSISGTSSPVLSQGTVTEVRSAEASTSIQIGGTIATSVNTRKLIPGSPLFNLRGEVIGVHTDALGGADGAFFYPIAPLTAVAPVLK